MRMYSLYDRKSQQYTHPFGQHNDACAVRVVKADVRRPGTLINENPEDFTLHFIGEFDENSGRLIPSDVSVFVGNFGKVIEDSSGAE